MHNPLFSVGKLQPNNLCNVFIGQWDQNDGNAIERCPPSGPQKHITKGFHNHSNLLNVQCFNVAQLGNHGPDHADDNPGVKLMSKLLGARAYGAVTTRILQEIYS